MVVGGVLNVSIFMGGVAMLVVALLGWLSDARAEYREAVRADASGHLENIPAPRFPTGTLVLFGAILTFSVLIAEGIVPPRQPAASVAASPGPAAAAGAGAAASPSAAPAASAGAGAPAASAGAGAPAASAGAGAAVTLQLTASGIAYDKADLAAPANTPFQIAFTNNDAGIPHNVSIHAGSATGTEVFKGEIFTGTGARTYDVPALPAGTYTFVCSVHPNMVGTLTVK
jgi:plastocyanin